MSESKHVPAVLRALADPTGRAVFERLCRQEMSVSQLKDDLPVSQPAVSQHLAALKAAGLVSERRQGRFAFYRAEPDGLAPLADWVAQHRELWPARVEKLKQLLKEIDK
jgi:DNA-binding transcriptional ArsR family regulator